MHIRYNNNFKQNGAVSLFIVIFTALLVTTITISFMQLMVRDQQQATYSDLSESAYDSAIAGVEDAKRALLLQQKCQGDMSQRCNDIRMAIKDGNCNTLGRIFGSTTDTETKIQQSEGDKKLEQAYTCVKITSNTKDFLGTIDPNTNATLVPLRTAKEDFNTVTISWSQNKTGDTPDLAKGTDRSLPRVGYPVGSPSWPSNRPALLRAQLINGNGTTSTTSFKLSDFDTSGFSNTLFLYPSETGLTTANFTTSDGRHLTDGTPGAPATNNPELIKCDKSAGSGQYICTVTIRLASTVKAGQAATFLSLAAFYNPTDFRVQLSYDSSTDFIEFDGVQPEVDSTGRANDLFRRVVSRVELEGTFQYPVAALETAGNLCKTFSVTTDTTDYVPGSCTP